MVGGGDPGPTGTARALRFGLVGVSGVGVNLGLLYLLVRYAGLHYTVASPLAIEASILTNFLGNRLWTWRDRESPWHALLAFHAVALVGMVLQWATLVACVESLGLHYLEASLLGILVGSAWNFLANHHFTFAHRDSPTRRRLVRPSLYVGAFLLQVGLAILMTHDWDTWVFQTTTADFLRTGTTPYETVQTNPDWMWVGTEFPGQAMWYAYPPLPLLLMAVTYWPAAYGMLAGPMWARVLVKLPFLVGNLVLALTAHRLVATAPGVDAAARARRVERLLLFNPLLILIASVWGMFEALLAALLLASVLALRADRWRTAGALWGGALLLKIFPLYLAPVLLVHLWRRGGPRAVARFFVAGGLAFALVSLPFFLVAPGGFLEQVFLMHGNRVPGRYGPLPMTYGFLVWVMEFVLHMEANRGALAASVSLFSFAATGAALLLTAASSARRPATERNLVFFLGCSLLWGLFLTKTVSEQYLILPISLLTVYAWHPDPAAIVSSRRLRPFLVAAPLLVVAAGLVANAHFLIFFPPDVARFLFGTDVQSLLVSLATAVSLHPYQLLSLLMSVAVALVFVSFLLARPVVRPTLGAGLDALRQRLSPSPGPLRWPRVSTAGLAAGLVALLVLPSFVVGGVISSKEPPALAVQPAQGRLVGIGYRLDWANPAQDPTLRYAAWEQATLVPIEGFYTQTGHRILLDMEILRRTGYDYVLVEYAPADRDQGRALAAASAHAGLPFAFGFDLGRLLPAEAGPVGLSPSRVDEVADYLAKPIPRYWDQAGLLSLGPEGRRPLHLAGAALLEPNFSPQELEHVARLRLRTEEGNSSPTAADVRALLREAPRDEAELLAHPDAGWRSAYEAAQVDAWRRVWSFMEPGQRYTLFLDGDADRSLLAGFPPGVDVAFGPRWVPRAAAARSFETATDFQAAYAALAGSTSLPQLPVVVPAFNASLRDATAKVHPAHAQRLLQFDQRWAEVLADPTADHVLVYSWNGHEDGSAIEPTLSYGDVLLERSRVWNQAHHAGSAATVVPWDPAVDPIPPPTETLTQYPANVLTRILSAPAAA